MKTEGKLFQVSIRVCNWKHPFQFFPNQRQIQRTDAEFFSMWMDWFTGIMNRGLNLEFQQMKDKCVCCFLCINFSFVYFNQRGGKLCTVVDETLLCITAPDPKVIGEGHWQRSLHCLAPLRGDDVFQRRLMHGLRTDQVTRQCHHFQPFRTTTLCPWGYKHHPHGTHRSWQR